MLYVLAIITTLPGQRTAVLEAFNENVPHVRAEKGCHEYHAVIDAPDMGAFQVKFGEDTFVVIEKWESKEALTAHSAAPHMIAYGKRTKDLLASRIIHVLA